MQGFVGIQKYSKGRPQACEESDKNNTNRSHISMVFEPRVENDCAVHLRILRRVHFADIHLGYSSSIDFSLCTLACMERILMDRCLIRWRIVLGFLDVPVQFSIRLRLGS